MLKAIQSRLNIKLFNLEIIEDNSKLLKYRRRMLWIIQLWLFSGITMISGLALGLAFGFHTVDLIILLSCCTIVFLTSLPSLFFTAWIDEIEKIFRKRHIQHGCPIAQITRRWALKMMFWAALIVLLPMLIRRLIS